MDNSLDLALFSDFIPAYEKNFVLDTHRIIFYSSIEIKNSITANTDEPVISQQLTKKAKEFLASEIDWLGKRAEKYFASWEVPVMDDEDKLGKKSQKMDIVFEYSFNFIRRDYRPSFIFEAKRLKSKTHEMGAYLGKEGLQRFIRGDYARNSSYAGMLGYVQTGDLKHWTDKLQTSFNEKYKDSKLTEIKVIEEICGEYTSIHKRRSNKQDVLIFHILLDFGK